MPLCIPHATGVPGLSGPPNWLAATPGSPQRLEIDDPRWVGSYSQGFGYGTAEEATFRALNHRVGGQTFLYLSWHVKFENEPSPLQDTLYVGFTRTAHPPLILKVKPYGSPGNTTLDAVPAADIVVGSRNAANGQLAPFGDTPDWITNSLRCWHSPGDMDWAVHLIVPIVAGATLEDDNGLDLPATFKMWYCYDIFTPTRADSASDDDIIGGVLRLTWPENATLGFAAGNFIYPDPNSATAPWLEYSLGSSSSPCATSSGISLIGYTSIGSNTPGLTDGQISRTGVNTLYAQPTNNSPTNIPVGALKARFSFANWGATMTNAPWDVVVPETSNTAVIESGTTALITDVNATWTPDPAWVAQMDLSPSDPNFKDDHQCMLVELSGVGLTFGVSSRYRNMSFVPNSTYSRRAEINVEGLTPISWFNRDVYLAVEALNMPRRIGADRELRPRALAAESAGAVEALNKVVAVDHQDRIQMIKDFVANYYVGKDSEEFKVPIEDLLDANLPTYRVHTYYDTGQRQTIDGKTYAILGLGSSFGFYGVTALGAEVEGWEHRLEGAIRIAENFYLLRVPNNGKAYVTTTLQSRAPGEAPLPEVPIQRWPAPSPLFPEGCPAGCRMLIANLLKSLLRRRP